ncbi:uncharacterized protein K489DRAFT_355651 [Dissoconium aciculare CBS 342.82]|uniref:Fe2OG dioxygenase domain-containing protein n=1 Tax=Dissoconium aciculare CBS 342.82 TaxID=1314786 RepID=A0A6J3M9R5_9PEZI|nr:uncharacterized protein K489DRAFT_355651 [Dissoconium aciculare CBS 342.82]KAF1823552.1 hypothetical protein K489DRAFT_355651 [Dissoconium aciculare CBS 342.82]
MDKHLIQSAPSSMYYIPDFISAEEEASIIDKIPSNRWITLSHRRLQAVPARLTATNTLLAATPLPEWLLRPMTDRFRDLGIFEGAPHGVNHCLINEYLPGQGIMPHEDGGAYHPVVATVSLGGTIVLDVTAKSPSNAGDASLMRWRILQEPRSLLVTTAAAYTETLHGIAEVHKDVDLRPETVANWDLLGDREAINAKGNMNERTTRISLTYRNVLKVSSLGNKLFGRTK